MSSTNLGTVVIAHVGVQELEQGHMRQAVSLRAEHAEDRSLGGDAELTQLVRAARELLQEGVEIGLLALGEKRAGR